MKAVITIMPKEGILDPQGVTVGKALGNLNIKGVDEVKIGKYVELILPGMKAAKAESVAREACERLLVNPNIESYRFELVEDG